MATATDPRGMVHRLDGDQTVCGQGTIGWSRTVTELQRAGLVLFCEPCNPPTPADLPDLRCPDCGHPRTGCGCSCTGPGTCGGGTDDIEGSA